MEFKSRYDSVSPTFKFGDEMKYKPCCGMRCMLGNCETRDSGGCYCTCRLVDYIHHLERDLLNHSPILYFGKEKEAREKYLKQVPKLLEEARARLKEYETR